MEELQKEQHRPTSATTGIPRIICKPDFRKYYNS